MKGETFKGMLFYRFDKPETADKVIKELSKLCPEFKISGTVYKPKFKQDALIEERAPLSFLLGLRWMLGELDYNKKIIRVNENRLVIKFNGKAVARTTIQAEKLIVEWLDPKWEEWKDLHDSNEFKGLLETAFRRLKQASETIAKGKGKGLGASVSA